MNTLQTTTIIIPELIVVAKHRHGGLHRTVRQCVYATLRENGYTPQEIGAVLERDKTNVYKTWSSAHDADMKDEAYKALFGAVKYQLEAEYL